MCSKWFFTKLSPVVCPAARAICIGAARRARGVSPQTKAGVEELKDPAWWNNYNWAAHGSCPY